MQLSCARLDIKRLERLCNMDRFRRVERLHRRAFAWEPQGYIPLGIHIANPDHAADLTYDDWLNPEPLLELRGSAMLVDLIDRPEACKKLIALCAELQCLVTERFHAVVGSQPGGAQPTNFAVASPGVRLGDDSICNLSREMIQEFCGPIYAWVSERYGDVGHIHFCSLAHSRFDHIYEALCEMPEVAIVSSQFAFEYYEEHLQQLRGRLAVEAFYGDALRYVCRRYGSFADWAKDFVPRFKNESGLVLYCQVDSVEEGKEMWARWQEAHARALN